MSSEAEARDNGNPSSKVHRGGEAEAIPVDGSFGEGGGQIIRNAVSLACILRKQIKVFNIRSNRPNPGLASQHLESIIAIKRICGATTDVELRNRLTEFVLNGEVINQQTNNDHAGIQTTIDLITAGSVSLCVQVLLPYLLTLKGPSHLKIIGGTHVMKAPSYDYLQQVFIPIMTKRLGYQFDICLLKPGYFPRGGGSIQLDISQPLGPGLHFKHFEFLERGRLLNKFAILNMTPKISYAQKRLVEAIRSSGVGLNASDIELRTVPYASMEYFLQFENTWVGFYHLVEGRHPSEEQLLDGIKNVSADYKKFMESTAAVDDWMQDQLIIYMALAKLSEPNGSSTIRVGPLTDHTTSAIHVVQLMTGQKFTVQKEDSGSSSSSSWLISI